MSAKYQHDTHHLMSSNDNKWNGIAKTQWRRLCNKRMICKLLKCLLDVKQKSIKSFFKRNLFITKEKMNQKDIKEYE